MIKPMLCRLQDKPFNDERYLWEIKFDGVRCLAKTNANGYALQARSGSEKTNLFPELELRTKAPAILDGELVCYAPDGSQQFNLIQHRVNRMSNIEWAIQAYPVTYEVFDILAADDVDLMRLPLFKRKEMLQAVLIPTSNVRASQFTDDGVGLFREVRKVVTGTERGIVGKPKASLYLPGNRSHWIKIKAWELDTFNVCGFTAGMGWRASTFGALVLSRSRRYVGMVGTGFDKKQLSELDRRMRSLEVGVCPVVGWDSSEPVTWIKPEIQVVVQYLEYTNDGRLRFPSFKGEVQNMLGGGKDR